MERLQEYESGVPVTFKSHQGKGFDSQYDPSVFDRPRAAVKIKFDKTTLFIDAAVQNDEEQVELLLEQGTDPNVCNADGLTALHQVG